MYSYHQIDYPEIPPLYKKLTVADAVAVANNVIGAENASFEEFIADINFDDRVSITDATEIINAIMVYYPETMSKTNAARSPKYAASMLAADDVCFDNEGNAEVSVYLRADRPLVALQADFSAEDGVKVKDVEVNPAIAATHSVTKSELPDGGMRVVVFSTGGNAIDTGNGTLFNVVLDGHAGATAALQASRIYGSTAKAEDVELGYTGGEYNNATGIDNVDTKDVRVATSGEMIRVLNAAGKNVAIYIVSGQLVYTFTAPTDDENVLMNRGMYIVKVGSHTEKVIL